VRDWVAARTAAQLLGSAAALLGAWQFWRFWRARNAAREDTRTFAADERPLGCLERLDAELTRRGLGRAPGETLERHAARVEAADALVPGDRAMAAEALRAYSALRYGGGDEAAVSAAMDAASARLRSPL
jgi:hypothetical protein